MLLPLLTRISAAHPAAASRLADAIRAVRTAPEVVAEAIGSALWACEQALRTHDAVHQARVRRAEETIGAVTAYIRRASADAEARRWKAAN
jgi:hypothetical protein